MIKDILSDEVSDGRRENVHCLPKKAIHLCSCKVVTADSYSDFLKKYALFLEFYKTFNIFCSCCSSPFVNETRLSAIVRVRRSVKQNATDVIGSECRWISFHYFYFSPCRFKVIVFF